jgi:LysR family nitrogen assimilation transcriptional regulator
LELETLRLLLVVAEQESFTRAASKLGIRQSSLSRQIQRLEKELDTLLLYRNGRGVNLTAEGEKLQRVAKDIFAALDTVTEELQDGRSKFQGKVTLGLPPSLGATISAAVVRQFQESFPDARLTVLVAFSGTLLEWLEAGRIDAGVLYEVHRSRSLLVTPLLQEYLFLISAPRKGEPLQPVQVSELGIGPYVVSSPANGMRRIVDAAAARSKIKMNITAEIDSLDAIKEIVGAGPERCVLPFGAVHREVKAGSLTSRRFDDAHMQALLVLATPLHRPVTRLATAVLQLVEKEVSRCVENDILSGVAGWDLRRMVSARASKASPT